MKNNERETDGRESMHGDVLGMGEAVLERLQIISRNLEERVRQLTGISAIDEEFSTD